MASPATQHAREEELARSNVLRLFHLTDKERRNSGSDNPITFLEILDDTLYSPQVVARTVRALEASGDLVRVKEQTERGTFHHVGWSPLFWH